MSNNIAESTNLILECLKALQKVQSRDEGWKMLYRLVYIL